MLGTARMGCAQLHLGQERLQEVEWIEIKISRLFGIFGSICLCVLIANPLASGA